MVNIAPQSSVTRPPVVVVLGHVDHGKTTLLDVIRETNIAGKESGGITQHIGAYQAEVHPSTGSGPAKLVTFLDTPGHEAFSAIRSRGAKAADVAILVVAADESIKPQTQEAISIIKQAEIPFVVAINKIDKPGANPQKVKQDLAGHDVLVEDWGGAVPVVEISAKEKRNIEVLLEMVLLVAEMEELKKDLSLPATGIIIESNLDKRRGYIATALVQKGILSVGDWLSAGTVIGKIKSMEDFMGKPLQVAEPSQPVLLTGWSRPPEIGREFTAAYSKDTAQELAATQVDLAPLFSFFKGDYSEPDSFKRYLKLIIKGDVSSSLEAIDSSLRQIKSQEVGYVILSADIGAISDADVNTAVVGGGTVIGFRVPIEGSVGKLAEKNGINVATFDVIYELIEYVRKQMANLLEPEVSRITLGKLKVLAIFKKDSRSQVVGGKVVSGKVARGALCDVIRGSNSVMTAKIGQVQHNKEDVSEVAEGLETGLRLDIIDSKKVVDIQVGDILEIYQEEKISRSL